jgi:peptidoglycan/LPS O-acetylase OafA/YrhL
MSKGFQMATPYRPDIDGLRAVAVCSVLLFHVDIPGFAGGFIGVDIFFVISGFLITSIIVKDLGQNRFSTAHFYNRRIRRLFPAFFVMQFATILAAAILFDAEEFERLGKNAIAATTFVSNIVFWREIGYFAPAAELNPLLHTWSLSVEEQFYLLFPLLMWRLSSCSGSVQKRVLLLVSLLSLAVSSWGVFRFPSATFYLLPTRAWELLIGSLLGLGVAPSARSKKTASNAAILGLLLIAVSVVALSERNPFPGFAALPPTLGTVLLIWSGMSYPNTWCGRLLSVRPLVFLGSISYSLYLWHWPIIAFWKYGSMLPLDWFDSLAIIVLSCIFGFLSWHFIEQPFRSERGVVRSRGAVFALAGAAMLAAITMGAWLLISGGVPERFSDLTEDIEVVRRAKEDDNWNFYAGCETRIRRLGSGEPFQPPLVGNAAFPPTFAFVGDSHARALLPAIEYQARRVGVSGYVFTQSAAPPLDKVSVKWIPRDDDQFNESRYYDGVIEFLRGATDVSTIILCARWPVYVDGHYVERGEERRDVELRDESDLETEGLVRAQVFERGLARLIERLVHMDRTVVLVACVPEIGVNVPAAYEISRRLPWFRDLRKISPTRAEFARRQLQSQQLLSRVANRYQLVIVEPDSVMWGRDDRIRILADGELLYRDDDHLSFAGARYVASCFDAVFDELSDVRRSSR